MVRFFYDIGIYNCINGMIFFFNCIIFISHNIIPIIKLNDYYLLSCFLIYDVFSYVLSYCALIN